MKKKSNRFKAVGKNCQKIIEFKSFNCSIVQYTLNHIVHITEAFIFYLLILKKKYMNCEKKIIKTFNINITFRVQWNLVITSIFGQEEN